MSKKRVVLIGNYGAGNLGDELLALGAIEVLKTAFGNELELCILHGERFPIDPEVLGSDLSIRTLHHFPTGFRSFAKGIISGSLFDTITAFKKADYIVWGGGGLFNCEVPKAIWIWGWQLLVADLFTKGKLVLLGNSFKSGKGFVNWVLSYLLNKADLISVRDRYSYDTVKELLPLETKTIVKENTDLVFATELKQTELQPNESTPYVLVSLREYVKLAEGTYLKVVDRIIAYILENTDYNLKLVAMDKSDEQLLTQYLLPNNKRVMLTIPENIQEVSNLFHNAKAVIAMRLHAYLMAFKSNKPALALSYADKVSYMVRKLEAEPCMIDLRSDFAELTDAEFASRMQCMLKRIDKQDNQNKLKDLRIKSLDNAKYLKGLSN